MGLEGLLVVVLTNQFMENRTVMTSEHYIRLLGPLKDKIRSNRGTCPPSSIKRREHE
jgi:hypothetical protein